MNKMKNKNVYLFSFVALVLIASIFVPSRAKADLSIGDLPVVGVTISVVGDRDAEASMSYESMPFKQTVGLETYIDNVTTDVALGVESFADEKLASSLLQTDGVTREFSDSYTTSVTGLDSGTGVYQTLRLISEDSFTQYNVLKDTSVYGYSLLEPLAKTINDSINAQYSTLTYLNLSVEQVYMTIVFDRAILDDFFTKVKASALFPEVSEEYSTNQQLIVSLLDPVFTDCGLYDIVYSPTDVSSYADDWSLAKETRAVLGLNASDTSFDGAAKTVSLRNLFLGYIGWLVAPLTVVNAGMGLEAVDLGNPSDPIFGFEATPTTYSIKFNVLSDFTESPTLTWDLNVGLTMFGDAETVGTTLTSTYYWFLVIGSGAGVWIAVTLITLLATQKQQYRTIGILLGLLFGVITSVIVFLVTTVTVVA